MRVLVTGAGGFIGGFVAAALDRAGHRVVRATRKAGDGSDTVYCDLNRDLAASDWRPRLDGIDAVVNCAGILRERRAGEFLRVHEGAPAALFEACRDAGITNVVQVSALGDATATRFIASKHAGDARLLETVPTGVVIRPSYVYSPAGSYGGGSLLRAMAGLYLAVPVIGRGDQLVQPIAAEDLAGLVLRVLETDAADGRIVEAVGPEVVTFGKLLDAIRRWLGFGPARFFSLPWSLARVMAGIADFVAAGPVGGTMLTMLAQGNVGRAGAADEMTRLLGRPPMSVEETLGGCPSQVQDRWHARLYFVRPVLRLAMGWMFVLAGIVGIGLYPVAESARLLATAGVPEGLAVPLVYVTSALDIALGLAVLAGYRVVAVGAVMFALVLAYTVFLGVFLPDQWLHPFGPLTKNLVILPAIGVMMALEDQR